ncbi:MAG: hypothetical protein R3D68_17350 [Hyphomicrobiaceae bacterium]
MSVQRLRALIAAQMASGARLGVLGLAALSAGCASQQASHTPPPSHVAAAMPKVEIEDDGLPVQIAPRNQRPGPDDPTEPFSPNYGSVPTRQAAIPSAVEPAPALPPMQRAASRGPTRMSSLDEDDIIRRAIAAHEMRNR